MIKVIIFILGMIFGGILGLLVSCLCITSKNNDIDMYENIKNR